MGRGFTSQSTYDSTVDADSSTQTFSQNSNNTYTVSSSVGVTSKTTDSQSDMSSPYYTSMGDKYQLEVTFNNNSSYSFDPHLGVEADDSSGNTDRMAFDMITVSSGSTGTLGPIDFGNWPFNTNGANGPHYKNMQIYCRPGNSNCSVDVQWYTTQQVNTDSITQS